MTIKDKILLFLEEMKIKKADFFLRTGIAASNFKGIAMNSELGGDKIVKILTEFPDLSADWLLLGFGSMLRSDQTHPVPQPAAQATVQDSSSGEAAIYYKMYKEEKAEKESKVEELNARMLKMAEEIGNLKAQAGTQKEPQAPDHPPLAFDSGFVEAFTEAPSGGSTKDYAHMRKPTTIKKSSASKT